MTKDAREKRRKTRVVDTALYQDSSDVRGQPLISNSSRRTEDEKMRMDINPTGGPTRRPVESPEAYCIYEYGQPQQKRGRKYWQERRILITDHLNNT